MKKLLLVSTLAVGACFLTPVAANAQSQMDNTRAIVQFDGEPLSTYVSTRPPKGKKIDFNSATVKSYRAHLAAIRNNFKTWLHANAPTAKVTGEFDIALNAVSVALNGTSLATLRGGPQVNFADYEGIYYPTSDPVQDPDLGLIQAISAWQQGGGSASAGNGVRVAIIDTGIDVHHPCFDDAGYPAQRQLGDRRFTNNKVIAAKVFNNRTVTQGYTAQAVQEHGTHVAGTVACNFGTPATVSGVAIPYGISGVAPRALLGNYNIFPGPVADARDEDIFDALEAAYQDGFDIANMSLGGGYRGIQDIIMAAVDRLDMANMVVAIAAGNEGPGFQTVSSPGAAPRALTAGASTVAHFVGAPVTVNGNTYGALAGSFATVSSDLTAPLAVVTDNGSLTLGCAAFTPGSLAGKIALISRGTCSFSTKIRDAQTAGASAVLVVNNQPGDPIEMGTDGTPNQPTIPAYMLSQVDGAALLGANGSSVTISAAFSYFQTANADIMASFSSRGPTLVDFRIKPDVVAPGVNVLSSIPLSFCNGSSCWAFFQGTSMATPHLAGSAAVLHWLYPDWSAGEVRSAIINTADDDVLKDFRHLNPISDVNVVGAGRENLLSAVNAAVGLDPVSVSFGAVPYGAGQTKTFTVTLNNLRNVAASYSLSITPGDASVSYAVTPSKVSLSAGGSATITVIMSPAKGATLGGHQAKLSLGSGSSEVAHAAVYTLIK
ncbi:MAG TPA: S8 family serine peptidase [Patescibacteria group bacterium]|nr:S8 family serine peptidase [Patescibacteria group bacterium]